MVIVAVVAFPLGIGAAVYLEEYARDTRLTRFINDEHPQPGRRAVDRLRHPRSRRLRGGAEPRDQRISDRGCSLISGGLTLAILVLPIVIITTAEALRAVPTGIREAAYGVGATRWEVIRSHVLPYAAPGILTGVVLSLARAFGETAPLFLVGAVTGFFDDDAAASLEKLLGTQLYGAAVADLRLDEAARSRRSRTWRPPRSSS